MEGSFINKQTLANLNGELIKNIDIQNKTRGDKKVILERLLGNMKKVYQKLDKTKINDKNFNKIFETFRKYTLINTLNELKPKQEHFTQPKDVNVGPMAYNRDRDVAPTTTVKYLDRPQSTYSVKENYYDVNQRNVNSNVQMNDNLNDMRTPQSSRYTSNMAPEKAMEQLLSERQSLTPEIQRPSTPDFLKSKQVKNSQKAEQINTPQISQSQNFNFSSENVEDVKMKGDTYYLSGANLDSNYGSIEFGNNELTSGLPEVDETIDTNQRLEMLQQERNQDSSFNQNFEMNDNLPKPDFSKSLEENERQMMQFQNNKNVESQIQNSQKEIYQNKTLDYVSSPNTGNIVDKVNNMNTGDIMNLLNNYAKSNSKNNKQPDVPQSNMESYDSGSDRVNKYLNDLSQKQFEQMRQVQILQEQLQENLKSQMYNNEISNESSRDNDALKNELISKVKILTGQLEQEKKVNFELRSKLDEVINEKEDENDLKLKLIEKKKEEIRSEILNIGTKNTEIENSYRNLVIKENFVKSLIEKNIKLLKADKYTTLVNSKNYGNCSEFNYDLINPLTGVSKLELLSYDLPLNSNNINDTNNKFYFKFIEENDSNESKHSSNDSDSELEIHESEDLESFEIPVGNYDISTLIKKLNKVGKPYNITFSYNKNTSIVTIKSEKVFNMFKKDSSIMHVLGFNENEYINETTYSGNNSFDLRKCCYAYFYVKNINEEKPFAVMNISGSKNSYYSTDLDGINISNLEISIRNEDNTVIDFCNLPFTLELRFIYTNDQIVIEDNLESNLSTNNEEVEIGK